MIYTNNLIPLTVCMVLATSTLFAQDANKTGSKKIDTAKVHQLEDVYFHQTSNPNNAFFFSGKAGISTMENPQSTTIVSHEIIEKTQAQQLSDVLRNVNGVYITSSRGSAQDSYGARGYRFDSGNNMLKNGARTNSGTYPEVSGLERVEVLKGSAAILYGNIAPGGVVNLITKKPSFEKGGMFALNYGSWDNVKATADIYGGLNHSVAVRVNGAYENKKSFRDVVQSEKFYINPSILFDLSKNTQLIIETDFMILNNMPDFGVGSFVENKTQIARLNTEVSPRSYFGPSWQYNNVKQSNTDFILNHQWNKKWKLNFVGSYQSYTRDYYATERIRFRYNNNGSFPENSSLAQITKFYNNQDYTSLQANFTGKTKTGIIEHQILGGADADYTRTENRFDGVNLNGTFKKLNAAEDKERLFLLDQPSSWRNIGMYQNTKPFDMTTTPMVRYGFYAQDLISYKQFRFLAGLRYSQINNLESNVFDYTSQQKKITKARSQGALSPRIGLVYLPSETISTFASYSNSFIPNAGLDINNNPLKPSIVDQYELGIKTNYLSNKLGINFTLYQIDNSNLSQPDPNNVTFRVLAGKTRSQGAELDITGSPIDNLTLMAGTSFNKMVFVSTPNSKGSYVAGEQLTRIPKFTANLAIFYTLSQYIKDLKVGLMTNYVGNRTAGWNNTKGQDQVDRRITVKGFTQIDFTLGYQWKKLNLQGKVANINNVLNYNIHESYSVNPIMPRNLYFTLNYLL